MRQPARGDAVRFWGDAREKIDRTHHLLPDRRALDVLEWVPEPWSEAAVHDVEPDVAEGRVVEAFRHGADHLEAE